jgi:protein-S-isoprenylcysteine O-methyltransferase Ste14
MKRPFAVIGGVLFVASLLYFAVSYTWRFAGMGGPWSVAAAQDPIAINILLFSAFALHHSIFARTGIKAWIARVWPPPLERSLYVWVSSLLFLLACVFWQPVPGVLWRVSDPAAMAMQAGQLVALIFILAAARELDVLTLAGIRQVLAPAAPAPPTLDDTGPYRLVRHPIYLGWSLLVWLAPTMNGTRFVFAATSCLYLFLAVPFEERDLRRVFGEAYDRYARRVRWRMLPGLY